MIHRAHSGAEVGADKMIDTTIVELAPRLCVGRRILLFARAIVTSRRWRDGRPVPGVLSCREIKIPGRTRDPNAIAFDVHPTEEAPFGRGHGPRVNAIFS